MMTSSLSLSNTATSATSSVSTLPLFLNDPIEWLSSTKAIRTLTAMYSGLLEEQITSRFTLHLLNVQFAAFALLMPAEISLLARVACLVWFALGLCMAKRAYEQDKQH